MDILGLSIMTVGILMYGVVPLFADFNRTHAMNPSWTKHARFHVVTQVLTTTSIGLTALWLLWSPNIERNIGICIAAVLSFAVVGSFFVSAGFRNFYGGALSDAEGGMRKFRKIDLNAVNFGASALLVLVGRLTLL
jgi:hypothetical protein